jgi:hypothetical protein
MSQSFLKGLVIRTAAVRVADVGYIYACDLEKEKAEIAHTLIFRWTPKGIQKGDRNYNAHSVCVIEDPELGYVDLSGQGYYSVNVRSGVTSGDILEKSEPRPAKRRLGGFRSIAAIDNKAYAVGLRGMVYRLDEIAKWRRIDEGLPDTFEGQAIHGFGHSDLYAVGRDGQLWQFDGTQWLHRDLPTNTNLTAVKCAGDDKVYVAGHGGMLIRGRDSQWEVIAEEAIEEDIWDLEWFEERLYISTMQTVYQLNKNGPERVDFGVDIPKSCYQLSAAKDVMWSNGEFDIMSFNGKKWSRVV